MAQLLDDFGRAVRDTTMDLQQLRGLVRSLMKGNVGNPTSRNAAAAQVGLPPTADPKAFNPKAVEEIKQLLSDFKKNHEKEVEESQKYLEEIRNLLKDTEKAKEDRKEGKKNKPQANKAEEDTKKSILKLEKHALKKGSLYTHDVYLGTKFEEVEKALAAIGKTIHRKDPTSRSDKVGVQTDASLDEFEAALKMANVKAIARDQTKPEMSVVEASQALTKRAAEYESKNRNDQLQDLYKIQQILEKINGYARKVEDAFFGMSIGETIFKGIIKEEVKFIQDTRAAAFEVAGVTKQMRGMQHQFEEINKSAATTGVDRTAFQKDYLKNIKRGITDLKTANKITTTQLNTERMLGLEAGQMQDTFANWHQQLRMNSGQVAEMGRGLRDVARFTGLTGENLTKAVSSSEEFLKVMRNTATLSSSAAKNIIEISAQAQKLGVGDTINPLMKAMTNTNNLIREASNQTRALLINAAQKTGRVEELMNGVILKSKAGVKDMAAGLEKNLHMFGVRGIEEIDNLTDDAKMRLNLQLKAAFGIELGEMRQTIEALKEAGKTFGDRIEDINKKRKANLTLEEKTALKEEERRLKASKSMEILTALDEAAKGAKDMDQALAKFGTRRKEFEEDLSAMGIAATDNADVIRQTLKSAVENVNMGLKEAGKQELKIDSSTIEQALKDPAQFRELQATITKAEQQAAVAQKAQLDPVSEIKQKVFEINDTLRNMSQGILSALMNSIFGKLALIGTAVAGVGGYLATMAIQQKLSTTYLADNLSSVQSKHGGWGEMLKGAFLGRKLPVDQGGVATGTTATTGTAAQAAKQAAGAATPQATSQVAAPAATTTATTTAAAAASKDSSQILTHIAEILQRIATCVCQDKTQPAAQAGGAVTSREKKNMQVDDSIRKKNVKMQKQDIINQKKNIKSIKQGDKIQNAQQQLVQDQTKTQATVAGAAAATPPPTAPDAGWNLESLTKSGPEMAKTAAAILIMSVGVVALGAAIVFLAHEVIKSFDLDMQKVMETAMLVGAVAAAGGAIALAAVGVINALQEQETQDFIKKTKTNYKQLLSTALAIVIIGPAIVLLGASIVGLCQMILSKFKLNLASVAETAAIIAAVAVAGGAIMKGASEALLAMETMDALPGVKAMMANPMKMAWTMIKAALALVVIGPGIVLLGATIVKFSQWILKVMKIDATTAWETGATVAAIVVTAGIIAGAVLGSAWALQALGAWLASPVGIAAIPMFYEGAIALIKLAPVMMLLAFGIVTLGRLLLGLFRLDANKVAEIAYTVSALYIAAGLIAGAALASAWGLSALGAYLASPIGIAAVPLVYAGAYALLQLVPAMMLLATAIITMGRVLLGVFQIDSKLAYEIGETVASLYLAAGVIAGASLGAAWALSALGGWLVTAGVTYPLIKSGAIAILLMSGAMMLLATAIVTMGRMMLGAFDIKADKIQEIANTVTTLFKAAGQISIAVLLSAGALAALGWAMTTGVFWAAAGLAILGAGAILILTPAMMKLTHAILMMGKELTDLIQLDEAKKIAEGVKGIFQSAGAISSAVMGQVGNLMLLGALGIVGFWVAGLMVVGANFFFALARPIGQFVMSILAMGKSMTNAMKLDDAKAIADGVKTIFEAAGAVSDAILKQFWVLAKLSLLNTFWYLIPNLDKGADFFFVLAKPAGKFAMSILAMGQEMKNAISLQKAKDIAEGVKGILEAAGAISDAISSQIWSLIKLGYLRAFWYLIPNLDLAADFFMTMAKPAMKFTLTLIAMGRILVASAGGVKKIQPLISAIKGIGEIIEAVGKIMDTLMIKIVPMTKRPWFGFFSSPLDKLAAAVPHFESSFLTITDFLKRGIIRPIQRTVRNVAEVGKTVTVAKGLADLIESVGKIMETIMNVVVPMTTRPWFWYFGSTKLELIAKAVPQFESTFDDITHFVKNGIINPIKRAFKDCNKVKQVTSIAKAIAEAMNAIMPMMANISKVVVGLTTAPSFLWFTVGSSPVEKLKGAIEKIDGVFGEIIAFVKNGIIGPIKRAFPNLKKAGEAISMAKAVGAAVCAIVTVLDILANKLAPMAGDDSAAWWQFWKGNSPDKIKAISALIPKFKEPFDAIVVFLRDGLIGPVTKAFPNLKSVEGVLPIVKGVGEAITAVVGVLDALANKLQPMTEADKSSWFRYFTGDGPSKFEKLQGAKGEIESMWNNLVLFVRDGLMIPVAQAFPDLKAVQGQLQTVKLVADAVKSVAEVMETMSEIAITIDPMAGLSALFPEMAKTVSPLQKQIPMIQSMFKATTTFIQEGIVAPVSTLNPMGLQGAVARLKGMQQALTIMSEMIEALEGMMGLTQGKVVPETGISYWFGYTKTLEPITKTLPGKANEIGTMFSSITSFVQTGIIDPVSKLDGISLKKTTKILQYAAKAIGAIPEVIENLDEVMSKMSPGDYYQPKFPMDKIHMSKKWFESWFPQIAELIQTTIIQTVQDKFKEVASVKKAAKILSAVAMMVEKLPAVIDNLDEVMSMMDPKNIKPAPINNIVNNKKFFDDWFKEIGTLVKNVITIVDTSFGTDYKKIKQTAKIIQVVAIIMESLPKVIQNLDYVISMMSTNNLKPQANTGQLNKTTEWFRTWFKDIAALIKDAIMDTVIREFTDVKNVKNTAVIIKNVACMIAALPPIIENLDKVCSMLSPGDYYNYNFPMDRIKRAEKWFKPWFKDIATFIRESIVDQIKNNFGDVKEVVNAGRAMRAIACIIATIPPVIMSLDKAMSLMSPDQMDLSLPINKIMALKDRFADWFEKIAIFIKTGIVNPITSTFGDGKQLSQAARLMRAMAIIIKNVPPIITDLAKAISLMSEGDGKSFDDEAPIDRILMYKDRFHNWFEQIAKFMKTGIVEPVINNIGDIKQLVQAASAMRAMSTIITLIPKVIMGIANGLIPLIETDDPNKIAPAEKINDSKDQFADWFRQISRFMKTGIVDPVMDELGKNMKEILMTARILRGMSIIISAIPVIIKNLAKVFGPLSPQQCIQDSPIAILAANTDIFADWFRTVAIFLRDAIIKPILLYFPKPEEIKIVQQALSQMISVVRMLPIFLRQLSDVLAPTFDKKTTSSLPIQVVATMAIQFADWFFGIANALISGIIAPVVDYFPDEDDVTEVTARLQGMTSVVSEVSIMLGGLSAQMGTLANGWWWYSPELSDLSGKVARFSGYFNGIANSLNMGIIDPIRKNLPGSNELKEISKTIVSLTELVGLMAGAITSLSENIAKLNSTNLTSIDEQKMAELSEIFRQLGLLKSMSGLEMPTPQVGGGGGIDMFGGGNTGGNAAVEQNKMDKMMANAQKRSASGIDDLALNANKQSGIYTSDLQTQKILMDIFKLLSSQASPVTAVNAKIAGAEAAMGGNGSNLLNTENNTANVNWRDEGNTGTGGNQARPFLKTSETDIRNRVERDKATTQGGGSMGSILELGKIATSTALEAANSAQIVKLLEKLVKYMSPSNIGGNSGANVGDPQTKYTVTSPPAYYKWNTGKHNQVAGKGVSNIGSTSY